MIYTRLKRWPIYSTANARAAFAAAGTGWNSFVQGTLRIDDNAASYGQFVASNFHAMARSGRFFERMWTSPSLASLQHADLELASRGSITFDASVGLRIGLFEDKSGADRS